MKKLLFILSLSVLTAIGSLPAQANDANTVFNGINAITGIAGVFQRSNTNRHLNNIEQTQSQEQYRHYRKDQAAQRAAAQRAEASRRAAAQKAAADRKTAEDARIQAAAMEASKEAMRKRQLEALKY